MLEYTNKNSPLISIITVSFNSVNTIEQTILSVLSQTYRNIEYIIIDGGSTDGTFDIIKKYSNDLKFFSSEKDNGIFDAMNKGINKSNGILIGILNSDDWYELDAVDNIVSQFKIQPNYDVYHGIQKNINVDGSIMSIVGFSSLVLPLHMIQHPTCFIKKDLYLFQGFYDLKFKHGSDYDFILKSFFNGANFLFINSIISNFRLGGNSSKIDAIIEDYSIKYNFKVISKLKYLILISYLRIKHMIKKMQS